MSPGDLVHFTKVRLRDGTEVKAMVEPGQKPPISRQTAFHMILAASLLLEEAHAHVNPSRLRRRMELLRERMEDAMARENTAKAVISSRPPIPTVEDAE